MSHAIQILELSPPAMRHCGTASLQTDNTMSIVRCRTFLQACLLNSRMNRVIGTSSRTVVVSLRGDDGNRVEVINPGSRVGTSSVVFAHGRVPCDTTSSPWDQSREPRIGHLCEDGWGCCP